jgi:hypothetical protein
MVVLINVVLVVGKMIRKHSDNILEDAKSFKGGIHPVYNER